MIPLKSIQNIVDGYQLLEKDLASSNIDKKLFAAKSKEYSNISEIEDRIRDTDLYSFIKVSLFNPNDRILSVISKNMLNTTKMHYYI